MSKINNGGPVFPEPSVYLCARCRQGMEPDDFKSMSLRDWYAGQALKGLLLADAQYCLCKTEIGFAEKAYKLADAMIAERDR